MPEYRFRLTRVIPYSDLSYALEINCKTFSSKSLDKESYFMLCLISQFYGNIVMQ